MAKNTAMLVIGAQKETVQVAQVAILDILKSGQEQATIQKALEVFSTICKVDNVTISGCTFTG